jgi:hypothetical protein
MTYVWNFIRDTNYWDFPDNVFYVGHHEPLLLNWWNHEADFWPWDWSVYDYAKYVEKFFYGQFNAYPTMFYPRGVQIMDFYNTDLVYEVIASNFNRNYGK